MFISFVQICDDKMTDVTGDSRNLWNFYVETTNLFSEISEGNKGDERGAVAKFSFHGNGAISNSITFYIMSSFLPSKFLFTTSHVFENE